MVVDPSETVEQFRGRVRDWLAANLPRITPGATAARDSDELWHRARELQRLLYEGGFAGICFPREYGGLGLSYPYQRAFDEESLGYELPVCLNLPSFAICCATILDTGSEEQKKTHIAAAIRGDEVLVQLLSEPGGGSDLAGVTTRAERRPDGRWVLNGAKTWSTGAFAADYGLCLARTDWSVPKHEGLTMFLVPINHPGITLRRIEQVNGSREFCEEFLDDVDVGEDAVLGEVNNGWAVATRQLFHERLSLGNGSMYSSGVGSESPEDRPLDFIDLVARSGRDSDPAVRLAAGRALVHRQVTRQLTEHIFKGMQDGTIPPTYGTILRLAAAETHEFEADTALAIAETSAAVDCSDGLFDVGERFLSRQVLSIGGGTTEMARNVIAERILDMPREYSADRGVPFDQVRHNRPPT
ncbi:acyl-CoA dehydrogenase family protein [Mycobacterium sp. EPa45]|uniref:acyl-CoA dehydrogenase family protein n=1 Tax=Mycobacterium sp. EPa45 TaxID=1545728 RepID=UPI000641C179|nr:acyl-CoA dehydrogenase family protein [Mycobacterium sp. EPa45]AKK25468.1 acyl-CoA dehydrogenase [Mycobacterium sp. EPa45]